MSDIYLDPSAAALADAAAQLRHLTDTGHRVLVLGDLPDSLVDLDVRERCVDFPRAPRRARGSSPPTRSTAPSAARRCRRCSSGRSRRPRRGRRRAATPRPETSRTPSSRSSAARRWAEARRSAPERSPGTRPSPGASRRHTAATPSPSADGVAVTVRPADSSWAPDHWGSGSPFTYPGLPGPGREPISTPVRSDRGDQAQTAMPL